MAQKVRGTVESSDAQPGIVFGEFAVEWIQSCNKEVFLHSSFAIRIVDALLCPLRIEAITEEDVRAWVAEQLSAKATEAVVVDGQRTGERRLTDRNLSRKTVENMLRELRNCLAHAKRLGLIRRNPAAKVKVSQC